MANGSANVEPSDSIVFGNPKEHYTVHLYEEQLKFAIGSVASNNDVYGYSSPSENIEIISTAEDAVKRFPPESVSSLSESSSNQVLLIFLSFSAGVDEKLFVDVR